MKRLIKRASNQTLYHATSIDSFFSIMESGELRPQELQTSDWAKKENIDHYFDGNEEVYNQNMSNYVGYTFFATDQYSAQTYGNRAAGKSSFSNMYVIIKAELSEEVLMPDLNDSPNAKTWKDSAKDVGQVSVLGSVRIDQMTGVIIVMRDIHEVINTTFDNWKVDLKNTLTKSVRQGRLDIDDCYDLLNRLGIPNGSNNI